MIYIKDIEKLSPKGVNNKMSSIESDFIDNEIYHDALVDINTVKEKIENKNEAVPFFNVLGRDIFNSLYKITPKMNSYDDMASSMKIEHQIVEELTDDKYFNQLRRNTVCDVFNSTYGLNLYQEEAFKIIKEWSDASKENEKLMNSVNDILYSQQELEKLLPYLQDNPNDVNLQKQIKDLQDLINSKNQQFDYSNNQLNPNQKDAQAKSLKDLKRQLINVSKNVGQTVGDISVAFNSFLGDTPDKGGTENGSLKFLTFEDKIRLADKLKNNNNLKKIAKQLGKMKRMLGAINKKPSKTGYDVCDITTGNKISKCISSEKLLLSEPDLENNFYKKYLNRSLMQYDTKGTQEMQGPIIVCLDNSGSMRGQRDCWAKAIAIVMLQLAIKQKRNYRCILFDNYVNAVYDFDRDNYNVDKMLQMASFFSGGGTNFYKPLRKAVESIEESKFKKADVLFITDGRPDTYLPASFKKHLETLKKTKEFMIQGIVIGSELNRYMTEFCDKIITFKDLNKDNELIDIFAKVKMDGDMNDTTS